jgi:hypothetical protein
MSWRYTIAKGEAALQIYYQSFPARARAVNRYVDELIEQWRAHPPLPPRSAHPLNENEDYVDERTGDVMRNGLRSPGE